MNVLLEIEVEGEDNILYTDFPVKKGFNIGKTNNIDVFEVFVKGIVTRIIGDNKNFNYQIHTLH